jgi:acyl carrier protein
MIREQLEGMTDTRRRLTACFTAVFRALEEGEVAHATVGAVEGWDSLATVTLIAVVEEEFRIQVDPDDIEQFTSFEQALRYLEARSA